MHQSELSGGGELQFDLLAEIAVGATARVELCRVSAGPRRGELVAVKRLHNYIADDPQFVDMFRDEVWMTSALKHPHVVEVVGWGMEPGPWLAVELVRGVSLQRLMKTVFETGERFTERMVVYLARAMCDGLAAAHGLRTAGGEHLGLVHRDLTPGNILLGFGGEVKITDFGLAKAKQRLTKTLTGLLKGNPQYMSPEQISGRAIDGRSDVFALGVLLFELFSGRRPWNATSDLDAMRAITDEDPAHLLDLRPRIDKALVEIVHRCLDKNPARRWQTALELRDRFDHWLVAHGYRDDNQHSLARFVRRNAMRQMRWFERAVAGEFADGADPESGLRASVPPSAPEPPRTARPTAGTGPTVPDGAASRSVERPRAVEAADGILAAQHPLIAPADDGDWAEDGPTLIKKPADARKVIDERRARARLPSIEPTTQRQRRARGPAHRQDPAAAARRTVGDEDSALTTVPGGSLGRLIHDAAHAARPGPDATVQMSEPARAGDAQTSLGVVAPPDPDVPPLPGEGAVPDPVPSAAATLPAAVVPPAAVEPDGTATQLNPMVLAGPLDALEEEPPPASPHGAPDVERSMDFATENRRLAREAQRAMAIAGASQRAAAYAAEAARLAAAGDPQRALERLREAQALEEAIRRGILPSLDSDDELQLPPVYARPAPPAAFEALPRGPAPHPSVRRSPGPLGREGVTVLLIVTVGVLVVGLFALLLFRF